MIARYTRPEMGRIWSEKNGFQKWLDVEILAAEALAQLGKVPKAAVARIRKKARFNVARIRKIESEVKHDVIAFLSCVAESIGDDARFLHLVCRLLLEKKKKDQHRVRARARRCLQKRTQYR